MACEREQTHCVWREGEADDRLRVMGHTQCRHGKQKFNCAKCTPCPHGKLKGSCTACTFCPHGKVSHNCSTCTPCPHRKVKRKCAACKSARAGQAEIKQAPEIKLEPEIKQEPFTIRGYCSLDG